MLPARPAQKRNSELSAALARCRHALIGIGLFTAAINLLQLTGSVYMLEVYDRVLPCRSVPTLVTISILALAMFSFPSLAAYEQYRKDAEKDPDVQKAIAFVKETRCFTRYERSFFRPLFPKTAAR